MSDSSKTISFVWIKRSYIDSQARNLVIAIQSTYNIDFQAPTISTSNCAICVIYFLGERFK